MKYIDTIRKEYMDQLTSSVCIFFLATRLTLQDSFIAQRATALWVIDHLALRVGGEKGEDEADTVGCCSLRKEHVSLHVRIFNSFPQSNSRPLTKSSLISLERIQCLTTTL